MPTVRIHARRRIVLGAVAMTLVMATLSGALAGSARAGGATISAARVDYEPGDTVDLSGGGYLPGETVTITAAGDTNGTVLTSLATADAGGGVRATMSLPLTFEFTYALTAMGDRGSTATGSFGDAFSALTIVGPASPFTRPDATWTTLTVYAQNSSGLAVAGVPVLFTDLRQNGTKGGFGKSGSNATGCATSATNGNVNIAWYAGPAVSLYGTYADTLTAQGNSARTCGSTSLANKVQWSANVYDPIAIASLCNTPGYTGLGTNDCTAATPLAPRSNTKYGLPSGGSADSTILVVPDVSSATCGPNQGLTIDQVGAGPLGVQVDVKGVKADGTPFIDTVCGAYDLRPFPYYGNVNFTYAPASDRRDSIVIYHRYAASDPLAPTPNGDPAGQNANNTVLVYLANSDGNGGGRGSANAGFTITTPPVAALRVSGFAAPTTAGAASTFTVTAVDANGNAAPGYRGTVAFSSGDPKAILPASYAFQASDNGVRSFSATLETVGTWSLTATDQTSSITGAQTGIQVTAGAPASVLVTPSLYEMIYGGTASFAATVSDAYGNVTTASVVWSAVAAAGCDPTTGACTPTQASATGYTVTASAGSATGGARLIVDKAVATVAFSAGPFVYAATPTGPTASTTPAGLALTLQYSGADNGGAAYSSAAAPTNAGAYAESATVTDPNYQGSGGAPFTIARAAPTVAVVSLSVTYDTSAHGTTASASGVNGAALGSAAVSYGTTGGSTPVHAGTYAATGTYSGSADYASATGTGTIAIGKAPSATVVTATNATYTASPYAGASATTTGVGGAVLARPPIGYAQGAATLASAPTDAGSYSALAQYDGNDDYFASAGSAPFTVAKVDPTVTASAVTCTYSGTPCAGSGTATGIAGVALGPLTLSYSGGSAPVNAGSSSYTASYAGNVDYNAKTSMAATITVQQAASLVTATGNSCVYSGSPCAGDGSAVGGAGQTLPVSVSYSTATGAAPITAGTYTMTVTTPGDANDASASATATVSIAAATPSVTVAFAPATVSYDGAAHAALVTVTDVTGKPLTGSGTIAVTYRQSGTVVVGAPTYAGSYSASAVFSSTDPDYTSASSAQDASLVVSRKSATLTAAAASKVYGGADPLLGALGDGFVASDLGPGRITFSATRATGESVLGGPYTITPSATDGGTGLLNSYVVSPVTALFSIVERPVTVSADPRTKTYGDPDPALTYAVTSGSLAAGDSFTGALTRSAGQNVGSYAILQGGLTLGPNYLVTYAGAGLAIAPRPITVTAAPDTKTYDGGTVSNATPTVTAGTVADGDTAAFTQAFRSAGAGTGKTLVPAGTVSDGNGGSNYAYTYRPTTAGSVTPLDITGSFSAANKTYDGTTAASVTGSSLAGVLGSDAVALTGTASFADKNVGTAKTVTASMTLSGASAANYSLASVKSASADITSASLAATVAVSDKVYDGTTAATVTGCALNGVVAGDSVACASASASFADAQAGAAKPVSAAPASLSGPSAGNYSLGSTSATPANITAAPVTASVTAAGKIYDGTTATGLVSCTVAPIVGSDAVGCAGGTAAFSDPNAGDRKTVNVTGLSLSGPAAANYLLSSTTAATTASIAKGTLTVVADDKVRVYGAGDPIYTATFTGFASGQSLATSGVTGAPSLGTAATRTSIVGTYPIVAGPGTLSAANYAFLYSSGTLTIGRTSVVVTWAAPAGITYGTPLGSTQLAATFVNGANAAMTVAGTATYVPAAGAILPAGTDRLSVSFVPSDTTDYSVPSAMQTTISVAKATPAVSVTGASCRYNGSPCAGGGSATGGDGEMLKVTFSYAGTTPAGASYGPAATPPTNAGTYTLTVATPGDSNNGAASATAPVTVAAASGVTTYTGLPTWSTSSSSSTSTTVTSSASVSVQQGAITTARVTFLNGTTPIAGCADLAVGAATATTGSAACSWTASIPNGQTYNTYTINAVLGGNYAGLSDTAIVNVTQPNQANFITGGGYLALTASAGTYAGTSGSRNNFGFNVKYTKNGSSLQGNVTVLVRRGTTVYQFKGNSLTNLTVSSPAATFTGKANLQSWSESDPSTVTSLAGNLQMQLTMHDSGTSGSTDTLGITVWDSSGALLFSSDWGGAKTVEMALGGGNLQVH